MRANVLRVTQNSFCKPAQGHGRLGAAQPDYGCMIKLTCCTLTYDPLCAWFTPSIAPSFAGIPRRRGHIRALRCIAAGAAMKAKVVRARINIPPPPLAQPWSACIRQRVRPCAAMLRTACYFGSMPQPEMHHVASRTQAVIGAGAAGLVAARELIREGHCVKVFEQVQAGSHHMRSCFYCFSCSPLHHCVPCKAYNHGGTTVRSSFHFRRQWL